MRATKITATSAALAFAVAAGAAVAEENRPEVEIELTSVALGVGGQEGEGLLRLPNLGTNCVYPFKVDGFGGGLQVGVSKVTAFGPVDGMASLADFPGEYTSTEGDSTVVAGGGAMHMENDDNGVVMALKTRTEGLSLGVGAKGLTVAFAQPITDGKRVRVLEFGYNKHWVSDSAKSKLDEFVAAWKCRYVNVELIGHSDSSGDEGYNVELSDKRAKSVRDYLIGAGFRPERITTRAAGEDEPLVDSGEGVRDRANRAVVVSVK